MANNQNCTECQVRVHGNDVHWIEGAPYCERDAMVIYEERSRAAKIDRLFRRRALGLEG